MTPQTFSIKSLYFQNGIMLFSLGVVLFFLVHALIKKRPKHALASLIWVGIVLWFFNSSFFGFSEVTVGQAGIQLNYGVLSFRNAHLPIDSRWRIGTDFSDIRKLKRVYLIKIAGRESMKLKGENGKARLEAIGQAIDMAREGGRLPEAK